MNPIQRQIDTELAALLPEGITLELPPPIFEELGLQFTDYVPDASLAATFPYQKKFTNPMGIYQGGIQGAALDACYGTLAFLATKKPCVSVSMDVCYVRPLNAEQPSFTVKVWLREVTRTLVFMEGEATLANGKLAATSSTIMKPMF